MTDKNGTHIVYTIKNKQGDYFAGFSEFGTLWENKINYAIKYGNRLHAETQALLLVLEDKDVRREAVRVDRSCEPMKEM